MTVEPLSKFLGIGKQKRLKFVELEVRNEPLVGYILPQCILKKPNAGIGIALLSGIFVIREISWQSVKVEHG